MFDPQTPYNDLPPITTLDINTSAGLSKLAEDTRVAIEILNYAVKTLPDPNILLDTLALQEARAALAGRFGDKIRLLGIFDDKPGRRHVAEESVSADGKTARWSLPCEKRTPDGIVVRVPAAARFLRARLSCPDPHTPAERRERRRAERRAAYGKYKAGTWPGMVCNKFLFRCYRLLGRVLQKKGIIPANSPVPR